jgi:hypothetical protein
VFFGSNEFDAGNPKGHQVNAKVHRGFPNVVLRWEKLNYLHYLVYRLSQISVVLGKLRGSLCRS